MHASRFETLLRSLALAPSRRTLSRALLGLAFGSAVPVAQRAAAKKKKPCPPCKKRKKGKCNANLPNETPCSGGKCQNGSCVPTAQPPPLGPGFCGYDGTSVGFQGSRRWAQTFLAPGATITAAKIGLRINPANFNLTFEIRPVDGASLPTSAVLGSSTVSNITQTTFAPGNIKEVTATFSPPVPLELGKTFALVLTGPANTGYAIHSNNSGNPCADGQLLQDSQATNSFTQVGPGDRDLVYTLTVG